MREWVQDRERPGVGVRGWVRDKGRLDKGSEGWVRDKGPPDLLGLEGWGAYWGDHSWGMGGWRGGVEGVRGWGKEQPNRGDGGLEGWREGVGVG